MKVLVGAILAAWLAAGGAVAADEAPEPAADAALACTQAPDMPLCLLRVLGGPLGGVPLINRPVFFGRRDLLAQAGVTDARALAWMARDDRERRWSPELFEGGRAVRDAVELDAGGASPEQALAPIEALDVGKVPDRRLYAYAALTYARRAEGQGLKPSRRLVELALSRWEAAMQERPLRHDRDDMAVQLGRAYAQLGDAAGAERAVALDRRQGHWLAIEQLSAQGRLDEAAEAARPTLPKYELLREVDGYRRTLIADAVREGRPDIAVKVAEHILQAEVEFRRSVRHSLFALMIVHKYAGPERTAYWAERLETADEAPLALAGHWGWMAVGQPDRARRITDRWLPLARQAKEQQMWGRGGMSEVQEMLLAEHRIAEIQWFGMKLPHQFIEMDLKAGRGVGRLDEYLELAGTLAGRRMVLELCAVTARSLDLLEESRTCALRFIEVDPLQGGLRALEIAEYAARLKQPELMREMVLVGLKTYERMPQEARAGAVLSRGQRGALEAYVAAEIAGRPRS